MAEPKMANQISQAEKRNGHVLGTQEYTDARLPAWSLGTQISNPPAPTGEAGAQPTDSRVSPAQGAAVGD